MENNEKEAYLYQEFLKRLSHKDFLGLFLKHRKAETLEAFGRDCYERLDEYLVMLEGKTSPQEELALSSRPTKELKILHGEFETNLQVSGSLRYRLKKVESSMRTMLGTIDQVVKQLGREPENVFYKGKEKIVESIVCPYCGKPQQKDFQYGEECQSCHTIIANPWKPHTICPSCGTIINVHDIIGDREGYELDPGTNKITCHNGKCMKRFDWKKFKQEPEVYGPKFCEACDEIYFPDKLNWPKQRLCQDCKAKGVDSFYLDKPTYQKQYRERKKVS